MILHVPKELTDALIDVVHVANEFVRANESRVRSFGKFKFCLCLYALHCIYMCTVILFRLTTLHMIGNKLFYNNIIQTSRGAGTIVVLTTGFIQCKV